MQTCRAGRSRQVDLDDYWKKKLPYRMERSLLQLQHRNLALSVRARPRWTSIKWWPQPVHSSWPPGVTRRSFSLSHSLQASRLDKTATKPNRSILYEIDTQIPIFSSKFFVQHYPVTHLKTFFAPAYLHFLCPCRSAPKYFWPIKNLLLHLQRTYYPISNSLPN